MRKRLILLLALAVLSAAALPLLHSRVNQEQDAVTLTETTLWGDPAAAQGMVVELVTHWNDQLIWNTVCRAGEEPVYETEFTFVPEGVDWPSEPSADSVRLQFATGNFGIGGGAIDLQEHAYAEDMLLRPVLDVAGRTADGETRTETVPLRDYYDYYPAQLELDGIDFWLSDSQERDQAMRDLVRTYFPVPVPEGATVTVTVTKDQWGNITEVDSNEDQYVETPYTVGAVTREGAWFALSIQNQEESDEVLVADDGEFPEGYGIYFLPMEETENDMIWPVTKGFGLVYPLDSAQARVLELELSPEGDRLLLFTQEGEELVLTVLDKETMEPVQRLPLPELNLDNGGVGLWQATDYLLVYTGLTDFVLLTPKTDGSYARWTTGSFAQVEEFWVSIYDQPELYFDGQRLAIAVPAHDGWNRCDFLLGIWEQEGLAYMGRYESSQTADSGSWDGVRMANTDPLKLRWEGT